jgi:hypothetical protein
MLLILFAFGLLCAVALWKLRRDTRDGIARMSRFAVIWFFVGREWWRWWLRREVFLILTLSLTVLGATACVPGQAEARARSSLDVLAKVIDPTWALAEQGCLAKQKVEVAREAAGLNKPEQTDAAIATIRTKCDAVTDIFERIRAAHLRANTLLDQGKVSDAEEALQEVLDDWQALRGGGTS